jgi:peptidoglycan L-alanyl-D-glutamate endopeptidase CwlK
MSFKFGKRSKRELEGVHPDLLRVVNTALELSPIDFMVTDGLRTVAEQAELVKRGASKTMNSKHLRKASGYGHAVDLVGLLNGKARWEWPVVYQVAEVMRQAAEVEDVNIRWGGCWATITDSVGSMEDLVKDYKKRKKKKGKKPFLDGPHFELA